MAAYTKTEAEAELVTWKAALKSVAAGQAYTIAGRSLTKANLNEIKDMVEYFATQRDIADRGGQRAVYNVIPVDC